MYNNRESRSPGGHCYGELLQRQTLIAGSAQELEKASACRKTPAGRKFSPLSDDPFGQRLEDLFRIYTPLLAPDAGIYDNSLQRYRKTAKNEISLSQRKSDVAIIIGGKKQRKHKSALHIASKYCKAYQIENAKGVENHPPGGVTGKKHHDHCRCFRRLKDITQEVIFVMSEIIEDVSFADMLNDAFKTVHTGERVTGTVSMVSPAEIHVDLGTKHTGIMPYDEAVTDSSVELEKENHVGDKVDVVIVKFNDSEGTVLVSKKRFDEDKNWNSIQEAGTSNEILTGKVKEAVKGGLIVNYKRPRVFVPASQSGLPRDADPTSSRKRSKSLPD